MPTAQVYEALYPDQAQLYLRVTWKEEVVDILDPFSTNLESAPLKDPAGPPAFSGFLHGTRAWVG